MGEYNYSPWLLEAHKELVAQLLTLAKEGAQAKVVFDTTTEARKYRNKVLEILANLARNRPEYAPLRAKLRTFIRYEGERYAVYIGVLQPGQKLSGSLPQIAMPTRSDSPSTSTLRIEEELSRETWEAVELKLGLAKAMPLAQAPDYIAFTQPLPPDGVVYITTFLAPQYEVLRLKPELVLERQRHIAPYSSANDALASQ